MDKQSKLLQFDVSGTDKQYQVEIEAPNCDVPYETGPVTTLILSEPFTRSNFRFIIVPIIIGLIKNINQFNLNASKMYNNKSTVKNSHYALISVHSLHSFSFLCVSVRARATCSVPVSVLKYGNNFSSRVLCILSQTSCLSILIKD